MALKRVTGRIAGIPNRRPEIPKRGFENNIGMGGIL